MVMKATMKRKETKTQLTDAQPSETSAALLRELVAHLRQNRTQLREEWARRITDAQLLTAISSEEMFSEATSVYDNYVEVLETGSVEALQAYARNLSERIIPRGVETHEVLGIVLLLRDVLARSLFKKYQGDFGMLNRVLDAYEPAANRIANTVGVSFVQERERIIREQQEAIRELSTPFCRCGNVCSFCRSSGSSIPSARASSPSNCCAASAIIAPRLSSSISPACRRWTRPWPTTWSRPWTPPA